MSLRCKCTGVSAVHVKRPAHLQKMMFTYLVLQDSQWQLFPSFFFLSFFFPLLFFDLCFTAHWKRGSLTLFKPKNNNTPDTFEHYLTVTLWWYNPFSLFSVYNFWSLGQGCVVLLWTNERRFGPDFPTAARPRSAPKSSCECDAICWLAPCCSFPDSLRKNTVYIYF